MKIGTSALLFFALYALYSWATFLYPEGGDWYEALAKPPGTPPASFFPVVWGLISLSIVQLARSRQMDAETLLLFFINWAVIQVFTWLFVEKHLLLPAAVDTVLVAYSTWLLIRMIRPRKRVAAYLLMPCLLWALYTAYLSWGIFLLNR
ncbi:tryptophan-rich sensory protein [Brevibacillus ruminantium]|uniref:Tryptophan-rich sensory protein n=1 Tax=Brevibacillus ruminantium TaxID=2950604 RepID=A0ABY4WEC1_9BACL|nr:TspO/MBR family protein [Brevibacillus ruminantium]USG64478.1 tryptophan-rich sensory protein [Brevibacillus ruminantium]